MCQKVYSQPREGRILITESGDFSEPALHQRLGVHGIVLPELDRLSNQRTSIRLPRSSSSSRRRPGSISAIDTGFRRYDEFFALRVDDRNFSINTLVATVISMNADKLPGNLLVIEPGRVRVRPLSR